MNDEGEVKHISTFLNNNHVLAVCAQAEGEMWSANCFYVADTASMTLYFMTELKTLHGTLMHKNSRVVGTIAPVPKSIALIQGIQYRGEAVVLKDEEDAVARKLYCHHFPIAAAMKAPVWALKLSEVKMTDNVLGFGKKLYWRREES